MCKSVLRNKSFVFLCCSVILLATGCRTASHAESGALVGAGVGSALGAVIGHQSGHTPGGAVVGALAGAMVGGLAGDAEDAREERDAAISYSRYREEEAAYHASKIAVTNLDLIDMAEAGLSDRVIVNAVQTRGGQFDLSPSAIIELKRHGLSDSAILSIQQLNRGTPPVRSEPYAYVPAPTVYIAPRPVVGISVGPRPYYRYHGHYGPYHRHYHHY